MEAWLALADVVDEPERAEFCLNKVLELDPGNEIALAKLSKGSEASPSEEQPAEEPIELEARLGQQESADSGMGGNLSVGSVDVGGEQPIELDDRLGPQEPAADASGGSFSVGSMDLGEEQTPEEPTNLEARLGQDEPVAGVESEPVIEGPVSVDDAPDLPVSEAPAQAQPFAKEPERPEAVAEMPSASAEAAPLPQGKPPLTKRLGRTDWILIGLTVAVGMVLCALVGVAVIGSSSLFSSAPAESPDEVVQVVFNNIIAANREDMAAYMGTIHPDAPGYETTQATVASAFSLYDLTYEIFIPEMLDQGKTEAIISYVLTTRRVDGPAFQDNTVTGEMTLRKFGEEWRIYDQTVDDVQYLN